MTAERVSRQRVGRPIAIGLIAILTAALTVLLAVGVLVASLPDPPPRPDVRHEAMQRVIAGLNVPGVDLGPVEQHEKCPVTTRTRVHTDDLEFYRPVTAMTDPAQFAAASAAEFERRGWEVDATHGNNVAARVEQGDVGFTVLASAETPGKEGIYVWYSGPGACVPGL